MRKIYVSNKAHQCLIDYLKNKKYLINYVKCPKVYPAIDTHPDIVMCHLGSQLFMGDYEKIGETYPKDVPYNCACTGKYFIHNLKYTDEVLLAKAKELGMTFINVKQGYTKCNTVIVNQDAIITSDMGIYNGCKEQMKVLLISPGQVLLPGMNTGFLGGASGRIGREIIFNGDLSQHKDFQAIVDFIQSEGLKAVWFEGCPLTDIGTIISDEMYI